MFYSFLDLALDLAFASAEDVNRVTGIGLAILACAVVCALTHYFSAENRRHRRLIALIQQVQTAVRHIAVSAETRDMLPAAVHEFYRAKKLKATRPALPLTLQQSMLLCEQQCLQILERASRETILALSTSKKLGQVSRLFEKSDLDYKLRRQVQAKYRQAARALVLKRYILADNYADEALALLEGTNKKTLS